MAIRAAARAIVFEQIADMQSIGQYTAGQYPSRTQFNQAWDAERVVATKKRVTITSLNPRKSFTFVRH